MSVKLTTRGAQRPMLSCPAYELMSKTTAAYSKFDTSNLVSEPIVGRHQWASPGRCT